MSNWSKGDKIAVASLVVGTLVATLSCIAAWLVVPGFKEWLQLDSANTPVTICGEKYLKFTQTAKENISVIPSNMPLKFPIGTNKPIQIIDPKDNLEQSSATSKLEVIGFISSGKAQPFTPSDLIHGIEYHVKNYCGNSANKFISSIGLVANKDIAFLQATKVKVVDIVAYNERNKQIIRVSKVSFSGIIRDALNAALTGNLKKNDYDLSKIKISQ